MKQMQGRRVYPNADGTLSLAAGDYVFDPIFNKWFARAPGCHMGDLSLHEITEHEDGTITVSPSILHTEWDDGNEKTWHGYLEHGVWREV
jgi:hypothetical protein